MPNTLRKTIDTCPTCGGTDLFFKSLTQLVKDRHLAKPDYSLHLISHQGLAIDLKTTSNLLIGSTVPGFKIAIDICKSCGTVFATELQQLEVSTKAAPTPRHPLNPNHLMSS